MAFRLKHNHETLVEGDQSPIRFGMVCYQRIADPLFDVDLDTHLEARSAWEMVRDQLSDTQRAELDTVDAYWRAHPKAFNFAFAPVHHQHRPAKALEGWVIDEAGKTPPLPPSHWWWRPLEEG